jgi:hypothetical protein
MTFKLSQRSLGNLEGVDKRLQRAVRHAIGRDQGRFWRHLWAAHD